MIAMTVPMVWGGLCSELPMLADGEPGDREGGKPVALVSPGLPGRFLVKLASNYPALPEDNLFRSFRNAWPATMHREKSYSIASRGRRQVQTA